MKAIFTLTGLLFLSIAANSQLPVDSLGWTKITAPQDSRIIFVSSSQGKDTNTGSSSDNPVASLSKAFALTRDNSPDQILLKTGDTWVDETFTDFHSGLSADQPFVLSYYGDSSTRPLIKISSQFIQTTKSNIAIIGLEIYYWVHDPHNPYYSTDKRLSGLDFHNGSENILLEDCVFRFFQITCQYNCKNFKMRRCIITDAWAPHSYDMEEHTLEHRIQGLFVHETEGILIEECLFDHNGWNQVVDGAGANMYNHNIYLQGTNPSWEKIIIRNNIISRGAAHGLQARAGGVINNNLFIQNAIHLNTWSVEQAPEGARVDIQKNILTETRQMDSTNAEWPRTGARFGLDIKLPGLVENNIISHSINKDGKAITEPNIATYINNIIYNFYRSDSDNTQNPGWIDPDRMIKHYHQSIGKEASTISFLQEARKRPLRTWWPEYEAKTVNEYLRKGFSTVPDTISPSSPDSANVMLQSDKAIGLEWTWANDDTRTIGYYIYIDNQKVNDSPILSNSYTVTGLLVEEEYQIAIKSVDVAGNESDSGKIINVTTLPPDTIPPAEPQNLSIIDFDESSVLIGFEQAQDNYFVLGYYVYLNGAIADTIYIINDSNRISNLRQGTLYRVSVTAFDPALNESGQSNEVNFQTSDTQNPSIPVNVDALAKSGTEILISWDKASDNVGIAGYLINVDGITVDTTINNEYILSGLSPGTEYTLAIYSMDLSGNTSRSSRPISVATLLTDIANSSGKLIKIHLASLYMIPVQSDADITKIDLVDITGNILNTYMINSEQEIFINTDHLKNSMYFLWIHFKNGGSDIKKYIKH